MKQNISVKELNHKELSEALSLIWQVFLQYETPDYTKEGIDEFYKSIHDENYLSQLHVLGAFENEKLLGVIATRNQGTHIALFFVDGQYQKKGIGKQLFQAVWEDCPTSRITVNSSPYAVPIYHKLGFCDTDKEKVVNGLRFTPMEFEGSYIYGDR